MRQRADFIYLGGSVGANSYLRSSNVFNKLGQYSPFFLHVYRCQEDHNLFLASVYVEGLKLRATIGSEGGNLKIEMFDGRKADPSNPFGGVEVRNVLSSAEASGNGAVIELESGKPIEIDGNW